MTAFDFDSVGIAEIPSAHIAQEIDAISLSEKIDRGRWRRMSITHSFQVYFVNKHNKTLLILTDLFIQGNQSLSLLNTPISFEPIF